MKNLSTFPKAAYQFLDVVIFCALFVQQLNFFLQLVFKSVYRKFKILDLERNPHELLPSLPIFFRTSDTFQALAPPAEILFASDNFWRQTFHLSTSENTNRNIHARASRPLHISDFTASDHLDRLLRMATFDGSCWKCTRKAVSVYYRRCNNCDVKTIRIV